MSETIAQLAEIFEQNKDKTICILGTTCCGKSTLKQAFPDSVDMDDVLWPTLTDEELEYICQKPWTKEIGVFTRKLVTERVKLAPGRPLFSLISLDCDLLIYLNISDELLQEHCRLRCASFEDAKRIKSSIEETVRSESRKREVITVEMYH